MVRVWRDEITIAFLLWPFGDPGLLSL